MELAKNQNPRPIMLPKSWYVTVDLSDALVIVVTVTQLPIVPCVHVFESKRAANIWATGFTMEQVWQGNEVDLKLAREDV